MEQDESMTKNPPYILGIDRGDEDGPGDGYAPGPGLAAN